MMCPNCDSYNTKVMDSRPIELNVFRKRKCLECGNIFHTEELTIDDDSVVREYMSAIKANYRKGKTNE